MHLGDLSTEGTVRLAKFHLWVVDSELVTMCTVDRSYAADAALSNVRTAFWSLYSTFQLVHYNCSINFFKYMYLKILQKNIKHQMTCSKINSGIDFVYIYCNVVTHTYKINVRNNRKLVNYYVEMSQSNWLALVYKH